MNKKKKKKNISTKCIRNVISFRPDMVVLQLKDHQTTFTLNKLDLLLNKYIKGEHLAAIPELAEYPEQLIQNRMNILQKYKQQLQKLKKLPFVKQRSDEWFALRKNRLTASDLDEALKTNNIRLAKKKAGVTKDTTNYTGIPALKWGVMFEPMATRCYSQSNDDIQIEEFGLIPHTTLEHFGASPDGINDMGIMIEIKCPYTREIIDNNILEKYYMQIQGQLAVCELHECDFVECDFQVFSSPYKYVDAMVNDYQNPTIHHGIIAEYKNKETGEYEYLYSEAGLKASDAFNDINKKVYETHKHQHLEFEKFTPWRLEKMNIQRITFDEELWRDICPKINAFWDKVEECKSMPVEEPKRKKIMFIDDD